MSEKERQGSMPRKGSQDPGCRPPLENCEEMLKMMQACCGGGFEGDSTIDCCTMMHQHDKEAESEQ
jgi:hypothetical protein